MGSSPGCAQIYNGKKEKDILSQYISFIKQVQRFFQKYGITGKAVEELFRYCIDHNILKEYLLSKQEVSIKSSVSAKAKKKLYRNVLRKRGVSGRAVIK